MRHRIAVMMVLVTMVLASSAVAGRYEQFRERFAKGSHMQVAGATFFGTEAVEEFVAAVQSPDGDIVAVGNSWGPSFPTSPKPVIWGTDRHLGSPVVEGGRRQPAVLPNADTAGMLVFYNSDLSKVQRVIRLGWGTARLGDATLAADGKSYYIVGVAGATFASLPEAGEAKANELFVMRIQNDRPMWVRSVGIEGEVKRIFARPDGGAYLIGLVRDEVQRGRRTRTVTVEVLMEIDADGKHRELMRKTPPGKGGFLAVDPRDGGIWFGGDRNTHTGRQPWRQPYLYKYNRKGEKLVTLYEPNPKSCACGGDGNGLCSDSSVHKLAFTEKGDMVMIGWSDGGNSVFGRHPLDTTKGTIKSQMGMSLWGANVSSFSWILRIEPGSYDVKAWTNWTAYVPDSFYQARARNKPNGAGIDDVAFLEDKSIAFVGGSATGLVPTPNAFWLRPADYAGKVGGRYVAVLNADMSDALFSSYLPGYERVAIAPSKAGVVVVGQTREKTTFGDDNHQAEAKPRVSKQAAQQRFGGGEFDAHLIHLASPR